ncbi:peptidoglycan-binding protein [Methylobacterium sp. Leaf94]|uniref:L,D-transpeptidase family protein n=1 Tax=Methylobacterium sp. Leaf94 TaxID=1736250 RepID=UPI0006F4B8C1|nr:L,D-transpeptidase family protein [Methylobacterium sp. Leaf94]KQU21365.1 peptidoglycan-binding protein [Methylobacterium sp. Leaf94]
MGVLRSASVALSALLAGCSAYGAQAQVSDMRQQEGRASDAQKSQAQPSHAQAPDAASATPVTRNASVDPGAPEAARPDPSADSAGPIAARGPDANASIPGTPSASEATAPPPLPTDPQAAAIATRLADPTPLLFRLSTKDREAIQAFYALGAFKPVWIVDGALTPAAKSAAARLASAGEDGLAASAYPVPVLGTQGATEAQIADADLKLSAAVVLYARDARGGRIHLANLSRLITPVLDLPAPDAVLARIASGGASAGSLLQGYNPAQSGYLSLKARLAVLRGNGQTPSAAGVHLPPGPVLKLGMTDPRVPALRRRFGLETRTAGTLDAGPGNPEFYDAGVVAAVTAFQRARGLAPNGTLTLQTVSALSRPESAARTDDAEAALIVNMERWRWLPSDLGRDYVMVNIPEFRLRVVRDGRQRDEARVIVGKTESPTPIFSGMMEYAVVNPSWNVPPSILKNEFLPGLARDPNYAARRGYEVVYRNGNVSVRQPPGERNALGFIKFMFPNNHAVYLHDTPNRTLFSSAHRALSHGCVRVEDPFRFADAVLPEAWSSERLKKLIGKGERQIRLSEKLPVHLAYFTMSVDEAGTVRTLPDLYGYDSRMKIALGLSPGNLLVARGADGKTPEARRSAQKKPAVTARTVPALTAAPKPLDEGRRSRIREVNSEGPALRATAERPPAGFGEPDLWTPRPGRPLNGWW